MRVATELHYPVELDRGGGPEDATLYLRNVQRQILTEIRSADGLVVSWQCSEESGWIPGFYIALEQAGVSLLTLRLWVSCQADGAKLSNQEFLLTWHVGAREVECAVVALGIAHRRQNLTKALRFAFYGSSTVPILCCNCSYYDVGQHGTPGDFFAGRCHHPKNIGKLRGAHSIIRGVSSLHSCQDFAPPFQKWPRAFDWKQETS